MKNFIIVLLFAITCVFSSYAQKFALVDMEYILNNIPYYATANQQLDQLSERWQTEIDAKTKEADTLYKNYQAEMTTLTAEQKKEKEDEIVAKEKEVAELKYKYFSPEGELFNQRQSLMDPLQNDIYNAIKQISQESGYQVIFDRASSANIIFASPLIDISNEVLTILGYSK